MNSQSRFLRYFLLALVISGLKLQVFCQGPTPAAAAVDVPELVSTPNSGSARPEKLLTNYVEAGGQYLLLTSGFGTWSGGYVRGVLSAGKDTVAGEFNRQHEFGESGVYFAAGDTHNFTPNTYASITLGFSNGGFFLPQYRADAFINRKWLGRKQLVTSLGVGYYAAKDPHRDCNVSFGTTYYFDKPWILEEGARFNRSNPGGVFSTSGFFALTQGRNKEHYATVRVGYGQEAYQLIGPVEALSSFQSRTVSFTWRQWIGRNWGASGVADYYGNPYYTRAGASLGLFRDF